MMTRYHDGIALEINATPRGWPFRPSSVATARAMATIASALEVWQIATAVELGSEKVIVRTTAPDRLTLRDFVRMRDELKRRLEAEFAPELAQLDAFERGGRGGASTAALVPSDGAVQ